VAHHFCMKAAPSFFRRPVNSSNEFLADLLHMASIRRPTFYIWPKFADLSKSSAFIALTYSGLTFLGVITPRSS
jgi:hypothetical protein